MITTAFSITVQRSIEASVLVGLVLLVQTLLKRKLTPRWSYALWALVVLRLLLPSGPASAFSAHNLAAMVRPSVQLLVAPYTAAHTGASIPEKPPAPRDRQATLSPKSSGESADKPAASLDSAVSTNLSSPDASKKAPAAGTDLNGLGILSLIWFAGFLLLLGTLALRSIRFQRRLLLHATPANADLVRQLDACRARLGISRSIPLLLSNVLPTPALVGLLRPRVVLPSSCSALPADQLQLLFLHELHHLRMHDIALNYLAALLQSLHWFNPVLWWAFRRMHTDREMACDSMVLQHTDAAAPYSRMLVTVALHGATRQFWGCSAVAVIERKSQLRRRLEVIERMNRPGHTTWLLGSLSFALLLISGFTRAQQDTPKPPASSSVSPVARTASSASTNAAIIRGRVLDAITSKPLAGAIVHATADDDLDMRTVRYSTQIIANPQSRTKLKEAITDSNGQYEISVPVADDGSTITLDAICPEYMSLLGPMAGFGEYQIGAVYAKPQNTVERNLPLWAAPYVAGTVIDEQGKPISGIKCMAGVETKRSSFWIGTLATDTDGRFSINDFVPASVFSRFDDTPLAGKLTFFSPDFITTSTTDIYTMSPEARRQMTVRVQRGSVVQGTLLSSKKLPVASEIVTIGADPEPRRTTTDKDGRFRLAGLSPGAAILSAHSMALQEKVRRNITVTPNQTEITLELEPDPIVSTTGAVELLGMKLIDVTPELARKYDLRDTGGVLILSPGANHSRLGIGDLSEGDVFWMAGNKRVSTLREWVKEILRVNALPKPTTFITEGYRGDIRVVYTLSPHRGYATNTQYLKLTEDDAKQLQDYLNSLPQ